jgi:hypothetical protein
MLHLPMRQSCKVAYCMFDRPMQANGLCTTAYGMGLCECLRAILVMLQRASSSSLESSAHFHHGPMQAFFSAAILVTECYGGQCDSLARQPIMCLLGQCEHLHAIIFMLQWANSSSSAGSAHFYRGPMLSFCSAAIQLTECCAGRCYSHAR